MIVSLKAQRAFVYRNGVPIGVSTISSGMPGHETPTAIFTILQQRWITSPNSTMAPRCRSCRG
nr:L,D-transpeptidase family protein [Sphingomonas beigongshangi]